MRILGAFILAALLAGCAAAPVVRMETAGAERFVPVPGKAVAYIFRDEWYAEGFPMTVSLDGRIVGQTWRDTYFVLTLDPGPHRLAAHGGTHMMVLELEARPGEVYYVWQEMKIGEVFFGPNAELHVVGADRARPSIMRSRRLKPLF